MIALALLALGLYATGTLYPPSDASHAVFRVAVCLVAAGGIAIPRGRLVRAGLALWAAGIATSVLVAPDPWRAVWSTANRNEGAWQAAHYLLLVLVAAAAPRERLVRWLAVAAGVAAVWGLVPGVGWVGGRMVGSAGNPLYVAPLLLLGVWAAFRAGESAGPKAETWWILASGLTLALVATRSTGAALAVAAAGGVWLLARAPRWVVVATAVAVAVGLWFAPLPPSALIRIELGRVALHGIVARPLGWGAEGFPFVFDRWWSGFAPTGEAWHDRAHCLVLDRAIEWGVIGLAGWLMVVMAAWRRAALPERMAIAAYLGFGLTMFEMMWGAGAFAAVLGYTFQTWRPEGEWRVTRHRPHALACLATALALVVGAAQLAQSHAAATATDKPAMQRAIERWSPIGGDLVETYLKAAQTPDSLAWAAGHVETSSPHATQQAMLLALWDRRYCADLLLAAPRRPDVRELCGGAR